MKTLIRRHHQSNLPPSFANAYVMEEEAAKVVAESQFKCASVSNQRS